MIARAPGYTAVAVLTLALAIGATTAIFSVVNGALLRPLPFPDADRLIVGWERAESFPEMSVNYSDFRDFEQRQASFTSLGGFRNESFNLTGVEQPERLEGAMYSASLLPTLGVAPILGRNFTADEDRLEGPNAVLLSEPFWKRHFEGDRQIIGRTLQLDGMAHTIVGVIPAGLKIDKADVIVPLAKMPEANRRRGNHPGILMVGRLKPGVTLTQARTELEAIGADLARTYEENRGTGPALAPLHGRLVKDVSATLWLLLGAVGFVLLIAVANVANLTLARGTRRRREMAIRAAMGAPRRRLVRQLLVESALVGLIGGALGVVLALWGVDLIAAAKPVSFQTGVNADVNVDLRVLIFSVVVSVGAGVLFGLAPALGLSRVALADAIKEGDTRTTTSHGRTRNTLVIAEVALALILLIGAGLSVRAFHGLARVDLGLRPGGVLTAALPIPRSRYTGAQLEQVLERMRQRVRAVPGVADATISFGLPLAGSPESGFALADRPPPKSVDDAIMAVYYVGDDRFAGTLGEDVLAGRYFDARDVRTAPAVAVVDDVFARTHLGGVDHAVGKRFRGRGDETIEIVGVVRHMVNYGAGQPEPATTQVHMPMAQFRQDSMALMGGVTLAVRAAPGVRPEALGPELQRAVAEVDHDQPIYAVKTMDALVDESLGPRRFAMAVFAVFAGLALLLALVGIYSVMSYVVAQRTHEIGVRMALGARAGDVQRLVVVQGMRLVLAGVVLGIAGALAVTRLMASLLYGVAPRDPLTFAAVAAVLLITAGVASFLPARRATRVDPTIALRNE